MYARNKGAPHRVPEGGFDVWGLKQGKGGSMNRLYLWAALLAVALAAGQAAAAEREYAVTGEVQGTINYGDAWGYLIQDDRQNTIAVAMGQDTIRELEKARIGSVISLRYTEDVYTPSPQAAWQHPTKSRYYVPGSGKLVKQGLPNPWDN